jgi:hypothetical protein
MTPVSNIWLYIFISWVHQLSKTSILNRISSATGNTLWKVKIMYLWFCCTYCNGSNWTRTSSVYGVCKGSKGRVKVLGLMPTWDVRSNLVKSIWNLFILFCLANALHLRNHWNTPIISFKMFPVIYLELMLGLYYGQQRYSLVSL